MCPSGNKFMFIFFKNKLHKYAIHVIRLHNLKSDTDAAHEAAYNINSEESLN
jgi:hypothetical protein